MINNAAFLKSVPAPQTSLQYEGEFMLSQPVSVTRRDLTCLSVPVFQRGPPGPQGPPGPSGTPGSDGIDVSIRRRFAPADFITKTIIVPEK